MDISLSWLNAYLEPGNVTADEADDLLTQAGLPIEERTALPGSDVLLDVEVTSNRPDCLSHIGCAREVAAMPTSSTPRELVYPAVHDPKTSGDVGEHLTLENTRPDLCPLFTARVITGANIGPSPAWLVERLESIGQRPINNAVDITNFITMELGNPCHVFDLHKLAGRRLVIRPARAGEKLRTLDDKTHTLVDADLVVADAEKATSLAGVMGGGDSEVDEGTTDIVFEMATWDPVTVRTMARRLAINTDAGFRFQRGVDARTIDFAARRAAALLCELTGGTLAGGVLSEGAPLPEPTFVTVRPSRAKLIMGIEVPAGDLIGVLRDLEIDVEQRDDDELVCEIPPHRARDLTREIDLIEEIARVVGYDRIPVGETMPVAVRSPQPEQRALREVGSVLTGLGFDETVTFSFTTPKRAELFLADGLETVSVDDARRGSEPTLRPSVLAGLLACRRANQDARSAPPGSVRLFEIAQTFAQKDGPTPETRERRTLAMLLDVPGAEGSAKRSADDRQLGLRTMRGSIDALVRATHGVEARAEVAPGKPAHKGFDESTAATLTLHAPGRPPEAFGTFGLVSGDAAKAFEVEVPTVAAELDLGVLVAGFPPKSLAHALPDLGVNGEMLPFKRSRRWSASTTTACSTATASSRASASTTGKIFKSKQHMDRALASAEAIRSRSRSPPRRWSDPARCIEVNEHRRRVHPPDRHAGRGHAGLNPFACPDARDHLHRRPDRALPARDVREGHDGGASPSARACRSRASTRAIKSLNYLNNILAKCEAIDRGLLEAIMLNTDGYVSECTGDNIFAIKDGSIFTPRPTRASSRASPASSSWTPSPPRAATPSRSA
jgi:phenylalanyl-tRNA synthetase beta chain